MTRGTSVLALAMIAIGVGAAIVTARPAGNCWQMHTPSCCDEAVRLSAFPCIQCPDGSGCCGVPITTVFTTDYATGGHDYGYQQGDFQQIAPYGGCHYYPPYCSTTQDPQCRNREWTATLYCQKWQQNSQNACAP
jgi:hypothetical protein